MERSVIDNGISCINPPIANAMWELNPSLDVNVRNAMISREVSFSATLYTESGIKYVVVNRYYNNQWFSTLYTIT